MKQVLFFFCSVFFLFFGCQQALAQENDHIRVRLASKVPQAEFRVMQGEYQLLDAASGFPIAFPEKGEKWTVRKEGLNFKILKEDDLLETPYAGPIILSPLDNTRDNVFRYQNIQYRDNLILQNEANGVLAVNSLPVEKYLYGVVGKEMGTSAPLEALKAQAVVSRTYVLSNKGNSTRYDVGDNTNTQVYGGFDSESAAGWKNVKEAVDSTAGKVIYYDGTLIKAFFHSNSGGHTENSENVWLETLPYVKAVPSPWDDYAKHYPYQTNAGWPANTFNWVTKLSRNDLNEKVTAWNSKSNNKIQVGKIIGFNISRSGKDKAQDTQSKRVTELEIIGSTGVVSFAKDNIRSVLDLKSTLFDIQLDSQMTVLTGTGIKRSYDSATEFLAIGAGNNLAALNGGQSTYNIISNGKLRVLPKTFQNVVITGKGYGHGLGMSQWGAQGMAVAGYKYQDIIEHYYNQGKKDGRLAIEKYH